MMAALTAHGLDRSSAENSDRMLVARMALRLAVAKDAQMVAWMAVVKAVVKAV